MVQKIGSILKRSLISLLTLILVSIIVYFLYVLLSDLFSRQDNPDDFSGRSVQKYARPRQSIREFKFTRNHGRHRFLSIEGRHLGIYRKKLGFVRFALAREAVLSQGRLKIYFYPEQGKAFVAKELSKQLMGLAGKDSGGFSNIGRVTSLVIRPVTVEFYIDGRLYTSIFAQSGSMGMPGKTILFDHNVSVICGQKKLTAPRLEFDPVTMVLTARDYTLDTPEGKHRGRFITTDLGLTPGN